MRRSLILTALLSVVATEAAAATYVIAVGNNRGRTDEPALRFAERDAAQVADVLRRLGRMAPEHSTLLLGEDADDLRRILLATNVKLRASPTRAEGDALIVYYSGHADAEGLHLGGSTLPYQELEALVAGSPAQVRLLVVDSCRSGGITRIKGAKPSPAFAIRIDQRLEAEGMAIITSSSGTEDSQESESLEASFFTHHLLTALRGAADLDRDGRVTLNEAYGYTYRGTLRSTGRTARLQHPTYSYELKGKGDFTLTYPAQAGAEFGRLTISEPGSYLVLEGGEYGTAVAELLVEDDGLQILLTPGRYLVRRRSDTSYREYEVELEGGRSATLDRRDYEEITYARLLRKGGGARQALHSVSLTGAVSRALVSGYGVSPSVAAGYGVELPWLTFGLEGRFGLATANQGLQSELHEFGLRLRGERFIDLRIFSLGLGAFVEGTYLRQSFTTQGEAPSRGAFGFGFGALLAVERPLFSALTLRLEAGLLTSLLPSADIQGGAPTGERTRTALSGWGGLGVRWSL